MTSRAASSHAPAPPPPPPAQQQMQKHKQKQAPPKKKIVYLAVSEPGAPGPAERLLKAVIAGDAAKVRRLLANGGGKKGKKGKKKRGKKR